MAKTNQSERQHFYQQIDHFWHDLYNTEYALYDVFKISRTKLDEIHLATKHVGQIYFKTAQLLRKVDDGTLAQLGFPKETFSFIRLQTMPIESVISRMDFVVTEDAIKLLEFNSDTPTFIKETFLVNGKVCVAFGCQNPNSEKEQQLQKAVHTAILNSLKYLQIKHTPNIVFTSHGDHEEDRLTTMYLQQLYGGESQFLRLGDLRLIDQPVYIDGEIVLEPGLYDRQNRKIDILYRQTYPIEHLVEDEDPETSAKVGQLLLSLVEEKQLAIINPPSAFLLQSKAVMALIWGLFEMNHSFYTEEELSWIKQYFLPTYLDDDLFVEKNQSYVKKPAFGREGDTVEIYHDRNKVEYNVHQTYRECLSVYQQYMELPKTSIKTEEGERLAHYMFGSFLINGEASAIGIRAGGQITDNESYFLPVGLI